MSIGNDTVTTTCAGNHSRDSEASTEDSELDRTVVETVTAGKTKMKGVERLNELHLSTTNLCTI